MKNASNFFQFSQFCSVFNKLEKNNSSKLVGGGIFDLGGEGWSFKFFVV